MLRGPRDIGQLHPQETAQNRIAHQAFGPSALGFLLALFGNLTKKPLLNLCLHLDAVEFFTWFHAVTTSLGEWILGLRYPVHRR
jgi:hypothetical protein